MKTAAIIQARMGSTRLPGKVMKLLCGKTVLSHVITRVKACPLVDEVIVATTTQSADDAIAQEAEKAGVSCFRGSENDVLERYYLAAQKYNADVVVRVTSDCPLLDPEVLENLLDYFSMMDDAGLSIDYLSNTLERSYPIGLDAEVFTFNTLEIAYHNADQPYEREHVTPYIYQHPQIFALHNQHYDEDLSHYRWTLDTPEDLEFIEAVYQALYQPDRLFMMDDILELLKAKPHLTQINAHIQQKKLGE
ncbi:glycosyltransferase family protein [Oscillatoria sp. FACHB-1407]|uniref:cytidylyltransferase domain-containing protein n=1 Tax=Oscillatoria sp. FACHB-1407 TaxID=2692847 RepID=UPI0016835A8A|nr:glycosyltransferase family protein [Oscillatoria sp. FACHB-1407]MBD2464243.1 glycosyltransferase family protein [Oscillatoria sp. FACHB-1407]